MSPHSHTADEFWREFFRMYRSMPELWLVRSKLYRNRRLKAKSYGRLLQLLRANDQHANIHTLKRKINNFRSSYRREFRKVLQSGSEYVPSLWYFEELDFLRDVDEGHPKLSQDDPDELQSETEPEGIGFTQQNESGVEEEYEDDDMYSEPFHTEDDGLRIGAEPEGEPEPELDQEPEPETVDLKVEITPDDYQLEKSDSPGRERTSEERRIYYREPARKRRRDETPIPERDMDDRDRERETEIECDLIGKRMATHFRQMKPDQRLFAERIISEVLVYGRMDRLSFEARFVP
ncbi:uncharacterized protein LOC108095624 isoform X2 [Drosophila ficusphila]|uniref:uncharacterized protein LOC108095624 isoform X2 n=1 Tax=Drosophila ficusphila TaxID=30025 RepID=UPI0007E6E443|nr:uncharacterized protein LOC108095624 isoform X2 [Drosophila ficusphila]